LISGLPSAADSLLDLHAVQEDHTVQSAAAEVQQAHLATLLGRSVKTWGPGDDMAGRHGWGHGWGWNKQSNKRSKISRAKFSNMLEVGSFEALKRWFFEGLGRCLG